MQKGQTFKVLISNHAQRWDIAADAELTMLHACLSEYLDASFCGCLTAILWDATEASHEPHIPSWQW